MERLIKKVIKNKSSGQLLVYIDKQSSLQEGDYVELMKVPSANKTTLVRHLNKELLPVKGGVINDRR